MGENLLKQFGKGGASFEKTSGTKKAKILKPRANLRKGQKQANLRKVSLRTI